jgi:hypothetical protein
MRNTYNNTKFSTCILNLVFAKANLRQGVTKYIIIIGGKSGVSGRTRLLPGTLAHALVVLNNTFPTGQETFHEWEHIMRRCRPLVERFWSVIKALLNRFWSVSDAQNCNIDLVGNNIISPGTLKPMSCKMTKNQTRAQKTRPRCARHLGPRLVIETH